MKVRTVTKIDNRLKDGIAALLPQLNPRIAVADQSALDSMLRHPGTTLLGAFDEGSDRLLGMCTLVVYRVPSGVKAWIEDVVVDSAARGMGIGSAMIEEALRLACNQGAAQVDLTSRPERKAANRLYRQLGFSRRETNVYRRETGTARL
jgi:ribosomal protein S18 acetylase RimI-like enzyme